MPEPVTRTVAPRAARLLSYAGLLARLHCLADGARVAALWRDVFGEDVLGKVGLYEMETGFARRVHEELFPLDLFAMDDWYYNSEEYIYELPIPVVGLRIPWEICVGEDLPAHQRLIADCIGYLHSDRDGEFPEDDSAPYVEWLTGGSADEALAWLAEREPAGLADLVRLALAGPSGNPFLDWPGNHGWAMIEYCDHDFYWTPEDIKRLADLYAGVRPIVDRVAAFEAWYETTPDPDVRILALLLEAGEHA